MPLRVHCPSGCLIRLPSSRAGKIVRCPECKQVIRLASIPASEVNSGKPIPMTAEIVTSPVEQREPVEEAKPFVAEDHPDVIFGLAKNAPESVARASVDGDHNRQESEETSGEQATRRRLAVPEPPDPKSARMRRTAKIQAEEEPEIAFDSSSIEDVVQDPSQANLANDKDPFKRRVQSSHSDRVVLARFFAACLCVVAIINLVPAIYHWYQWSENAITSSLPRWIYLQAFVAALHVIWAVYLIQLPDWSALQTVAAAMLAVAAVFGCVSTGLVVGGGQGSIAQFLHLPYSLVKSACIWCVAMLCLATLMSYLSGREAANWRRTQQLLDEILSSQTPSGT